ncbi:MAG: hypothetical protein KJ674_05340 [Nanoarchaeota archaeon]|nr:hypothetical protein [Nanoarchaeota archaeon]
MFEKKNKIEVIFIALYFVEQVTLILLYIFSRELLPLWISIFPVIFLTTIAFEKVFMKADFEERRKDLENQLKEKKGEGIKNREIITLRDQLKRNKFFHNTRK